MISSTVKIRLQDKVCCADMGF